MSAAKGLKRSLEVSFLTFRPALCKSDLTLTGEAPSAKGKFFTLWSLEPRPRMLLDMQGMDGTTAGCGEQGR